MAVKKNDTAVLPVTIKVNGFDVSVRAMTDKEQSWSGAAGSYGWGCISLDVSSPPQRVAMCLVHELLHACFEHSGLRCKFQDTEGENLEEEIVSYLGFSIAQMIGSQPELTSFIQGAFAGKTIEVPQECISLPISGNWVLSPEGTEKKIGKSRTLKKK
jgi:hypothetical protein